VALRTGITSGRDLVLSAGAIFDEELLVPSPGFFCNEELLGDLRIGEELASNLD